MFRSDKIATAVIIYKGMFGLSGHIASKTSGVVPTPESVIFILLAAVIIATMPNTQQIMRSYCPALNWRQWRKVGHFARPLAVAA